MVTTDTDLAAREALRIQRARAAAITAAYWPRTSTNAEFAASLAEERAKRERELSAPVECGAQRAPKVAA